MPDGGSEVLGAVKADAKAARPATTVAVEKCMFAVETRGSSCGCLNEYRINLYGGCCNIECEKSDWKEWMPRKTEMKD